MGVKAFTERDESYMNRKVLLGAIIGAFLAFMATKSTLSAGVLDSFTFHPLILVVMAVVYIVFSLIDGRRNIILLEVSIAVVFLVIALIGLWVLPLAVGVGLIMHGLWDIVHHPKAVTTKVPGWYPPLCAVYDFLLAGVFFAYSSVIPPP